MANVIAQVQNRVGAPSQRRTERSARFRCEWSTPPEWRLGIPGENQVWKTT